MSNQITHLYYAEKLYNKFLKDREEKDFFLGAVFPDVRYVAGANKETTHFYNNDEFIKEKICIDENDSSFLCGVKIHNLIDLINTKHLRNSIYDIYDNKFEHVRTPTLFLEDVINFDLILDLNRYINFFDEVIDEEIKFNENITIKDIEKWHQILKDYLFNAPTLDTFSKFSSSMGCFSQENTRSNMEIYSKLKDEKLIIDVLGEIRKDVEALRYEDIFSNKI